VSGPRATRACSADVLSELATAYASEVGALAGLVLQHRATAEAALERTLVAAARDPRLPDAPDARRLHLLRLAWRETLRHERRSGAVDPLLAEPVGDGMAAGGIRPAALQAAMAELPARSRALVALRFVLDLDAAQLAAVAGDRPGRTMERLDEAVGRLRWSLTRDSPVGVIEELDDAG